MIEKVNVMHSYPTSSPAISRRRMRSSGTSSVSSYDVPKTPLDPYSALHQGRLGKEFSVLRTNKLLDSALTRTELCQDSDEYAELAVCVYAPLSSQSTDLSLIHRQHQSRSRGPLSQIGSRIRFVPWSRSILCEACFHRQIFVPRNSPTLRTRNKSSRSLPSMNRTKFAAHPRPTIQTIIRISRMRTYLISPKS
jgi:hypothetical protein